MLPVHLHQRHDLHGAQQGAVPARNFIYIYIYILHRAARAYIYIYMFIFTSLWLYICRHMLKLIYIVYLSMYIYMCGIIMYIYTHVDVYIHIYIPYTTAFQAMEEPWLGTGHWFQCPGKESCL